MSEVSAVGQPDPMHLLCVTVLLDPVTGGGTAERTFQLAKYLSGQGQLVTVLTTDIGLTEARRKALRGVEVVGMHCLIRRFFVVEPRLRLLAGLVRRADVIHLMGHWNLLNVFVVLLARWYRVPYVICPAGELKLFGRTLLLKRVFNSLVGKSIIRDASGWIAVTRGEFPEFKPYGVADSSIRVLPNGIETDELRDCPESEILARLRVVPRAYILFMGRLNKIKGPDLLLGAFGRVAEAYPDLHLVYAGPDGGMLASLKEEASRRGLESRVHFAGYLAGSDKASLYKHALFLAIPSRHEAMSIVVLEAGAVNVPVLLTDQCGFDRVAEIMGGIVVEADEESIAGGIEDMLRHASDLEDWGRNLNRLIVDRYSWDIIGRQHREYFESLLKP